jgi:GNAT superfamily N-acetyltransferase
VTVTFRRAGPEDAVALRDLERAASLAALGHVFPPDRYPYPSEDVLARWHLVLTDPDTMVDVVDGDPGLACGVAYDVHAAVRQVAVSPARWGEGLGRLALERAVGALSGAGATEVRLWCLAENTRARAVYEHLGWRVTGAEQPAPWAPYPTEVEYLLAPPRLAP